MRVHVFIQYQKGRISAVFCGDALFVGEVGRPDLFPGIARELANKLYDSLHKKLLKLPDFCEVYPAYGAGSLCGRAMGAKRTSTIGYERKCSSALQISDREEFIKSLTTKKPCGATLESWAYRDGKNCLSKGRKASRDLITGLGEWILEETIPGEI